MPFKMEIIYLFICSYFCWVFRGYRVHLSRTGSCQVPRFSRLLFYKLTSSKTGFLVQASCSSLPDRLRTEPKGWAAVSVSQTVPPTELPKLYNLNHRREAGSKGQEERESDGKSSI
ncbi:hypothetical protein FQA47_018292 [Oryzias melastigma]|uniref:Uncharacterized protein n=1 Tax=Oryzias melastigma TaxID=30732 RepID=A0A834FS34_ORYME|nr:hypothetical protein FQA47_018292 [Oryzias melastigma]